MKIGITERGDAGLDLSWTNKLDKVDGVIAITKNITPELHNILLSIKKPVILHATITGWGGTDIEPNVPEYKDSIQRIEKLIRDGFDANRIVLRVDPIIPTEEGLERAGNVIKELDEMNTRLLEDDYWMVDRLRISVLDMYRYVADRLNALGHTEITSVYNGNLYCGKDIMDEVAEKISEVTPYYIKNSSGIELCAEPELEKLLRKHGVRVVVRGCVSIEDLQIMTDENGTPLVPDKIVTYQQIQEWMKQNGIIVNAQNRRGCQCLSCKTELLENRARCPHQCAYCYWK